MEERFKVTTHIIDEEIRQLIDSNQYEKAKDLLYVAARQGSFFACNYLGGAFHPNVTIYPHELAILFTKSRRKANKFYNRELKSVRREVGLGIYPAMFQLYNLHNYPGSNLLTTRHKELAEYWLRKAAESGSPFPNNELKRFESGLCS